MPVARVPALTVIVVCAPAASAGTFAVPTFVPPIATTAVVAAEPAVPEFRTVAPTEIACVGVTAIGFVVSATWRSGLVGTGVVLPNTCSSATWALEDPVFAVNTSRTSVADPVTGIVTVLPDDGLNAYAADALRALQEPLPVRPSTANVCVRLPHAASGLSLTTTPVSVDGAASDTVRFDGYAPGAPSQYVAVEPSTALPAT